MSWCQYHNRDNKCREMHVIMDELTKSIYSIGFCFTQLEIQRLIIESMPKHAFQRQIRALHLPTIQKTAMISKPIQLGIKNVDLSMWYFKKPKTVVDLLCEKIGNSGGKSTLRASNNDLIQFFGIGKRCGRFDHWRTSINTRAQIVSVVSPYNSKIPTMRTPFQSLQVGNESLEAFKKLRLFPTFSMGHCLVTSYGSVWLREGWWFGVWM